MAQLNLGPFDENGMPVGDIAGNLELARKQGDFLRQGANYLGSTALTNVVPDRALPGVAGYVPFMGMAQMLGGTAHMLGSAAAQLGNAATDRWGLHIPDPPDILKQAGEHYGATAKRMSGHIDAATGGVLPTPDDTTVGTAAEIIGGALGGGVGLAPARMLNVIPKIAGLRTAASVLVPTLEHTPRNMAIGGTLGTMLGGAQEAEAAMQSAPTAEPPATPASSLTDQLLPSPGKQAEPARTSTGDLSGLLLGSPTAPGPTFTQQGNTEHSLGMAALEIVGTLGAVAAGGHMYRRGGAATAAARDARFSDPEYAAKAQAYNADVISRGPGANTVSPPSGAPVPAPVPQGSPVRRATVGTADALANDAAKIQDAIVLTSPDPSTAERLSASVGNKFDDQMQQNKLNNFLRSGFDERTNMQLPPMEHLLDDYGGLTNQQKIVLGDGLRSLNELDNRANNRAKVPKGTTPDITQIRHDFIGKGDAELAALGRAMHADPVLSEMANRYKQVTDGLVRMGEHPGYGFFSTAEARDLLRQHPNYVPEMDMNGKPIHPFGERVTTAFTGQAQATSHPILDLQQHVEQMHPLFERNLGNREIYDHFKNAQQQSPQAAQFLQDITAPTGPHASYYPMGGLGEVGGAARDPIVAIRTPSGVVHSRVDSPVVYHALNSHSRASAQVRMDAWARLRRMYTQGTTGVVSLATGRAAPPRNAMYTAMSAPITAPKDIYAGIADRLTQRATGHTSSVARAVDMTANIPGTAASYARGVGDRRVRNIGNIFAARAENSINQFLRSTLGDAQVDKISAAALRYYKNTATAKLERMAYGGAGSPMSLAAPGVLPGTKAGPFGDPTMRMRSEGAGLSPKAYFDGQWMGSKPFLFNLQRAFAEAASHMSDAGHDFVGRLNLDNPKVHPETLAYELRNLVGNASRKGSSKAMQGATQLLPYSNVSVQGVGRFARAIGERPAAAPLTAAMGLGSMALLSILTHMKSAGHLDFLQNQITLQQREANVILATSDDPLKPNVIPLPQEMRIPYAFVLDAMSKAVNIVAARHDKVSFDALWHGLQDFFGSHVTTSNTMAMRHGMVDLLDAINLPPVLGRMDWNHVAANGLSSIPGSYEPVTGRGTIGNKAPGQLPEQESTAPLDTKTGQMFRNVLSNMFGAVAHVLDTGNAMKRYHDQGHSLWDSVGMGGRDWIQQSRESNMSMNHMLWETPIRLSVQPPIAETLQPQLNALKQLPAMPKPLNLGYTGKGLNRLPVSVHGEAPVSQDPQMIQMLMSAHAYNKRVNAAMAPIAALKSQMGDVTRMGMNPVERREWLNNQTRIIADRYKLVDAYVSDLNAQMSKFAGKPIRFTDVDWKKGPEQFR